VGVDAEPIEVSPLQLIGASRSVVGHSSGASIDSQDALSFSALSGVRPMIETMPLSRARGVRADDARRGTLPNGTHDGRAGLAVGCDVRHLVRSICRRLSGPRSVLNLQIGITAFGAEEKAFRDSVELVSNRSASFRQGSEGQLWVNRKRPDKNVNGNAR
jgi:hypothetical protein